MIYFVYILYSKKDDSLYVGCTTNINSRIKHHNSGSVQSTRNRRPLVVIHTEEFFDKALAFNRERFLKSLWSARFKKKIKKNYLERQQKV